MQYILTEKELKKGCELLYGWKMENIPLEYVYEEQKKLNNSGFFTIIKCTDTKKELYEITILQRSEEL